MPDRMQVGCLIVATLLAGGCASGQPRIPQTDQNGGPPRAEAALQDARAEARALRSDLAAARIAAAKQEAELRELRRQVNELQQILDAKQAELISLREERDRLTPSAAIAQVRVADAPAPAAGAGDVRTLQAKLRELESSMAALTAELAQMKQDMRPAPASAPTRGAVKR